MWDLAFDSATALIWCVFVAVAAWIVLRPRFRELFSTLAEFNAPVIIVVTAFLIYSTPQMREVLWIEYGANRSSDPQSLWAAFREILGLVSLMFTLPSGGSILLVTVALGIWVRGSHYDYTTLRVWRTHIIVDMLGGQDDFDRKSFAWHIALLFPTIVFFNAVAACFPMLPPWSYVLCCGLFYISAVVVFRLLMLHIIDLIPVVKPLFGIIGSLILLTAAAFGIFFFAPILFIVSDWNIAGRFHGNIVLVNVFLAASLSLLSFLLWFSSTLSPEGRLPIISLIIVVLIVFAVTDLNNNHKIHALPLAPSASISADAARIADLNTAFDEWFKSRNDRSKFGTEYPVYVVAAQGGGIYAAYHAGMFLSAVQDKYPDFAEHVFAISAVSGGSLGAAIFSALVNQEAEHKEDHWYWNHAQQFLKHDFLSELLSATLFLDLPARFFPCVGWFCPGDRLSRARALERSIESASLSIFPLGQNPFMGNVRELWDARKRAPALLLNTTEVETGERIVIAPWSLEDGVTPGLFSLSDRADDLQIRLSTAVGLSARFPWITPAGWFTAKTGAKRRLVDGGYSDNSGVVTALDLITRLKGRTGVQLIIIALVSEADDVADFHNEFFGELASPLRALDSTRVARGRNAVEQAQVYLNGSRCGEIVANSDCSVIGAMRELVLATGDIQVPLGWLLSSHSQQAIECSFGLTDRCDTIANPQHPYSEKEKRAIIARRQNKHLIEQIGKDLRQ